MLLTLASLSDARTRNCLSVLVEGAVVSSAFCWLVVAEDNVMLVPFVATVLDR